MIMNIYQNTVNQRTKYLMNMFCDRSLRKLRKRVKIEYKKVRKLGYEY